MLILPWFGKITAWNFATFCIIHHHPVLFLVRCHCAEVPACPWAWTCGLKEKKMETISWWPQKPHPPPVSPSPGTRTARGSVYLWLHLLRPPSALPLGLMKLPQRHRRAQVEDGVWAELWGGSEISHLSKLNVSRKLIQCPRLLSIKYIWYCT